MCVKFLLTVGLLCGTMDLFSLQQTVFEAQVCPEAIEARFGTFLRRWGSLGPEEHGYRICDEDSNVLMVDTCAWSPIGTKYAVAAGRNKLVVFDGATGHALLELGSDVTDDELLTSFDWSCDGTRIAVSYGVRHSDYDVVRIFDVESGACSALLQVHSYAAPYWLPGDASIVCIDDEKIQLWDVAKKEMQWERVGKGKCRWFFCRITPETFVLVGETTSDVHRYHIQTMNMRGETVQEIFLPHTYVELQASRDGAVLLLSGVDSVYLYTPDGKLITQRGELSPPCVSCIAPDGKQFAYRQAGGEVVVCAATPYINGADDDWTLPTRSSRIAWATPNMLLTVEEDGFSYWNTERRCFVAHFPKEVYLKPETVTISPDGTRLLFVHDRAVLFLWNIDLRTFDLVSRDVALIEHMIDKNWVLPAEHAVYAALPEPWKIMLRAAGCKWEEIRQWHERLRKEQADKEQKEQADRDAKFDLLFSLASLMNRCPIM